jgi:hypothetical protein
MGMISEARRVAIGRHTSRISSGGFRSTTLFECDPTHDLATEHPRA